MEHAVRDDEGGCMALCRSVKTCRTVQYLASRKACYMLSKTVLGVHVKDWITRGNEVNYYQKMCA